MRLYIHSIISWGIVILLWFLFYRWVNNPIIIPGPYETFNRLFELLKTVKFREHIYSSMSNLSLGWILSIILLFLLTIFISLSKKIEIFLTNIAGGYQGMPTFSLAPILLTMFGYSKITAVCLLIWSVIWYGTIHLIAEINKIKQKWYKHAKNLQWKFLKQFTIIYLPAMLPIFLVICKNSWSMMWRTLVAIELLLGGMGGNFGLATFMMENKVQYQMTETWSVFLVILLLGIIINKFFDYIIKKIDW
jgi:NitT/TauT family transport system permease protein